jgi:Endoplasmic reticulum vesicle transporter
MQAEKFRQILSRRCLKFVWMKKEMSSILQNWMLDLIMSPHQVIIVDLVMEGNPLMRMDVVIPVRKYELHTKPMVGQLEIITQLSNAPENSTPCFYEADCSYKENLLSQSHEGCNLAGYFQVNKVSGNFHIAPGRSFAMNGMHVHDTVALLSSPLSVGGIFHSGRRLHET